MRTRIVVTEIHNVVDRFLPRRVFPSQKLARIIEYRIFPSKHLARLVNHRVSTASRLLKLVPSYDNVVISSRTVQNVIESISVIFNDGVVRAKAASASKALCKFLQRKTPSGASRKPSRVTACLHGALCSNTPFLVHHGSRCTQRERSRALTGSCAPGEAGDLWGQYGGCRTACKLAAIGTCLCSTCEHCAGLWVLYQEVAAISYERTRITTNPGRMRRPVTRPYIQAYRGRGMTPFCLFHPLRMRRFWLRPHP
jgi:hypothetical protein